MLVKISQKLGQYYDGLKFEGEYKNGQRWNGKGKEYNDNGELFEGEYLKGKKMEKEKNIIMIVKQNLKGKMEKEKEKNILKMVI